MEVPARRMSQRSARIDAVSGSVRPLQTSSHRSRLGRAARTRANSRRFRSPTDKDAARWRYRRAMPTRSRICFASCVWVADRSLRPKRRAISTFSSTESALKGFGTWCVRAIPARTAWNERIPVMLRPWKVIVPEVGCSEPAMILRSVVFPAPFGPIRPKIPRSSTWKLTSFSAASPAKFFVRRSSLRMGTTATPCAHEAGCLVEYAHHSAGLKQDNQDQQGTVEKKMELGKRGHEFLMDEAIDESSNHRPQKRAHTADDRHQENGHADVKSKHALRINERGIAGVNASRGAREGGGNGVGEKLAAKWIHTEIGCGILVLANGNECEAELGAPYENGHSDSNSGDGKGDVIMQRLIERAMLGNAIAAGAARELKIGHDDASGFADADGRDSEVRASQPECRQADENRSRGRHESGEQQRRCAAQSRVERYGGGVCANAKEDSEAEGNLAREPAKNVPAHTGRDPDESYENETNNIGARMREGKGSHEEKQEDKPCL